jgi:hypothetical protein
MHNDPNEMRSKIASLAMKQAINHRQLFVSGCAGRSSQGAGNAGFVAGW